MSDETAFLMPINVCMYNVQCAVFIIILFSIYLFIFLLDQRMYVCMLVDVHEMFLVYCCCPNNNSENTKKKNLNHRQKYGE